MVVCAAAPIGGSLGWTCATVGLTKRILGTGGVGFARGRVIGATICTGAKRRGVRVIDPRAARVLFDVPSLVGISIAHRVYSAVRFRLARVQIREVVLELSFSHLLVKFWIPLLVAMTRLQNELSP